MEIESSSQSAETPIVDPDSNAWRISVIRPTLHELSIQDGDGAAWSLVGIRQILASFVSCFQNIKIE